MENNWKQELNIVIKNDINLKKVSDFLKSLKTAGITQCEIKTYLNLLRLESTEIVEDRILEILDMVEGFCNPQYRVW